MWWERADGLDVLVVCTGNVCRSPYVAYRLQRELPHLRVASAGTGALVGQPPAPQVRSMLAARGSDTSDHEGTRVTRRLVRSAQLVITAERRHRVEVVRLDSTAGARAFTLLELSRILRSTGEPRGLGPAGLAVLARESLDADHGVDHDDDLADPFGLDDDHYALMEADADSALAVVVPALDQSR